ncbi:aldehyde dehydrogenase family protein [Antrihabitans cavernicola]|uniref:Aldehyde dehydrogenase n=1 Tax=Antrihabitans cavernicola TaxID=2495913 RepID=A0A5A7S5Y8_9NOCA|nr:aldehyde dehydrogenase family protein [Spelaeibacter cavernicola]KAA0021578.1 aldehyde dehydrogenase family protein [Spelaeibacter cavernicola]
MAESAQQSPSANGLRRAQVLTSYDPRTGEIAGDYAVMGTDEVTRTLREARGAQAWWSGLSYAARKRWLLDWKKQIVRHADDLADVVVQETGKPHDDALLEIVLAIEHLDWAARNADSVLGRRKVRSGKFGFNQSATVGYEPMGVVGVIGPWNYPVFTPMGSIAYAMAAGNAVIFKPSELTPGVGMWLARSWHELAPNQPVLQTVTGDGETGTALCRSKVDKIAFTGSPATARRVMAVCAETLTPLVVEGGGKDAMIVHVDAKLEDAAEAAVFGAMSNGGQTCAGVERVYVAESVYEQFLALVRKKVEKLHPGADRSAAYGPLTLESQAGVVRRHIEDAIASGGRAVVGGVDSIREPYVEPVILTDVPEDSVAITEETFGPVVVINKVDDLEDAITRVNATPYGLGASIFTRDLKTADRVAARLRAGVVSVNSVLGFVSVPALPFGGVGDSGFGRIHGDDGLREFSRSKSITVQKYRAPVKLLSMNRKSRDVRVTKWMFKRTHG